MASVRDSSLWILGAMILLTLFTLQTCAQSPALTITNYSIQPEILSPGELGTVTITIKNTAVNVSADITDIYLFAPGFVHEFKSFEHVGKLGGGSSTTITFAFHAPNEAGIYFPEIHIVYHSESGLVTDTIRYPIPVRVNERTALKVASLEVEKDIPESIRPGDNFTLALRLANKGETAAHNIVVEIGEVESIYSNEPHHYYKELLDPGATHTIELSFKSSEDTPIGTIIIPIELTYEGLSSEVKKQRESAGIKVIGMAELSISNVKTEPLHVKEGEYFTLLIRIENTGDDAANSVKVNLISPLEGTKTAFLGKIEPDDDAPAVFTLHATKAGELLNELVISYVDDRGAPHRAEELTLTVSPKDNEYALYLAVISALIALGVCSFYLFRRKR